jgi:hypothetical protein
MKRYIKANQVTTGDIVVTYRNKIIYDGPISAEPTEIFKNIKNFNPETDLADKHLVQYFERNKDRLSDYAYAQSSYRNGLVKFYAKEKFSPNRIAPKEKIDPNTAVIDGERMTAEEVAQEVMSEADNYEYVYDGYQDKLSEYAKKVVENGWVGTSKDRVPFTATKYVVNVYLSQHSTRKQNIAYMCRPFLAEYMQEDYDRYKSEYQGSLNNETSNL